jgi:transcriptional regulator NrdR family protein
MSVSADKVDSMRCPTCSADSLRTYDSRPAGDDAVRRRRECRVCGFRFTTVERTEDELERTVVAYVRHLDATTEMTPYG